MEIHQESAPPQDVKMTIKQLKRHLDCYEEDVEVRIDVGGKEGAVHDVDWVVEKDVAFVLIHDFHPHGYRG